MSLKNKLNRLKPHITGGAAEKSTTPPSESARIEIPFLPKWESENVSPYFLDQDYCLIREVKYPLSQKHGHYHFHDFLTAVDIWNKQPISHPLSAEGHSAEELFFFDTETTGLGGGVGNTIFLLGYASVIGENLVLRQHILPHPGAEVPLYQSFLENVNYKTLVTYNGKSFDWPQVKTRHTLVRDHVPKLPAFGHFDLFHAAKRLWKHKLDRLKLAVVEKDVLGIERHDDIPGYLAPMIYFDFIDSKQPDGMLGIIKHNEIDILSLVTLYTHLTFQLCGIDNNQTRKESFEVGRWYAALGEKDEAAKVLTKLVEGSDFTSLQAKLALAYQSKKEQNWEISLPLFIEVADAENSTVSIEACIEASKIYEHKIKDYKLALDYCLKALEIVENNNTPMQKVLQQLETRLLRLEGKFAKFPR
ncbi:ribonuclease H-like domain-containing protein [Neobacillus sp. NPDC093182]|uniref:ribonuclease H-like domain-containing protein n=1 Tax=Neobacillus sp. NPDC093182 TaxID=3364297 RepID=UPI00382E1A43